MRAVDTNILVRLIADDDPAQNASARQFIRPGAWVSLLVLAETTWVLGRLYQRSPKEIAASVEILLGQQSLVVQDADTAQAALDQYRAHPKLGFSDCLILQIALKAGHTPLGTFDKTLGKLQGAQRL
jgi:predicted nucleic-acid-binding protein